MESVVEVFEGKIRGCFRKNLNDELFHAFLGVPYGKPPIGLLRFKAPLPAESWSGIKDCTKDGERCYSRDPITGEYGGSEDCLFLNVFTKSLPQQKSGLQPVMIFIHGGGYICGSNQSVITGPEHMLIEDIVLVTINYRLGVLGFLSFNDPSTEVPGNAGLKDQLLALKWVQNNIKQFNGDPDNVTVFGESAGSSSVHLHILSEQSEGLFHKAIMQSGVVFNPWAFRTDGSVDWIDKLDKGDLKNEKEALDILINLPVEELYRLQELCSDDMLPNVNRPFGPVVEAYSPSAFLTRDPMDIIKSGNYNKVPMIIGYNSLEGMFIEARKLFFPNLQNAPIYLENYIPYQMGISLHTEQFKQICELLNNFYRNDETANNKYNLDTDSMFVIGILTAIQSHLKTLNQPIYLYRFTFQGELNGFKNLLENSREKLGGACHGDDLGYLFKNTALPDCRPESKEHTTIKRFVRMWSDFARYGNPTPNEELNVQWKPVEEGRLLVLDFGEELKIRELPEMERMELWKNIYSTSNRTRGYLM